MAKRLMEVNYKSRQAVVWNFATKLNVLVTAYLSISEILLKFYTKHTNLFRLTVLSYSISMLRVVNGELSINLL